MHYPGVALVTGAASGENYLLFRQKPDISNLTLVI